MAKVTIKRRNESERLDGRAALYAVVNISKDKIRIPVGMALKSSEWDPTKERVRGKGKDVESKNLVISNLRAKISDVIVQAHLIGQTLTKESFYTLYNKPAETMNFIEYARRHLDSLYEALQPETFRHHESALNKLEKFNPELLITEITPEWLRVYAAHLRKKHNNNASTIGKNMSVIRSHYYAAMREGKVKTNPFSAYKIPSSEPLIVFLTEDELKSLIRLYLDETLNINEQDALRFFLFMTFTGMHITDASHLQIEQM